MFIVGAEFIRLMGIRSWNMRFFTTLYAAPFIVAASWGVVLAMRSPRGRATRRARWRFLDSEAIGVEVEDLEMKGSEVDNLEVEVRSESKEEEYVERGRARVRVGDC
jgi:hypothetical protein